MNKILITFVVVIALFVIAGILIYYNGAPQPIQPLQLNQGPAADFKANLNDSLFEMYATEQPLTYKYRISQVKPTDEVFIYDLSSNNKLYQLDVTHDTLVLNSEMDKYMLENNGFYMNLNKNDQTFTLQVNGIITRA